MTLKFLGGLFVVMLAAGLVAVSWAVGDGSAQVMWNGPGPVLTWGAIGAVCMGGVGALSGALIADMFGRKRIRLIAVLSAAVLATLAFWHPAALLLNGHELAAQLRQKAPEVSKFGLEHFRQIDTNGDGIITSDEMAQAQKHLQLSNDDRALLSIMQSRVDEIGHAISTERTPVYTSVPFGNGVNMPVYSGDTVSHTYGIDKDDLEHYPQRVAFQWEKW